MRPTWITGMMLFVSASSSIAASCNASSPAHTIALVELYTSEGCSSCPPAERWLSQLGALGLRSENVVPLALHVDYWNYLGWRDPFSQAQFSTRQRHLANLNRQSVVYTPQITLQGRDYRSWRQSARFVEKVREINQTPARARLNLTLDTAPARLSLNVTGQLKDPATHAGAHVYLALYENKLQTAVPAGENAGRLLEHDNVVRHWQGPFVIGNDGRIDLKRDIPLDKTWQPQQLGAAAFVQDPRNGDVLQALSMPVCWD